MQFIDEKQIEETITMKEVIDAIEAYYLNEEDMNELVPDRLFINDGDNTALLMPSFYGDYYGAKAIGIAPGNIHINEPTLRGIFYLNKRSTMTPLAIYDARKITAMRTGALSGLSMKYLAKQDASTVGVIGAGDQAWSHFEAAVAVRPIKKAYFVSRGKERLEQLIEKAKAKYPEIEMEATTIDVLVKESDIICATTTSKDPVIPNDLQMNLKGKHIAACGAFKAFMQEIPDSIIESSDRIFCDTHAAFEECGELIKAKEIGKDETVVPDLRGLVEQGEAAYKEDELTLFKSCGASIYDIVTAKLLYEKK